MGVRPVLRDISCPWWDGEPLRTPEPVAFAVTLEIADGDSPWADLFYLSICNPAYLSDEQALEWEWQDQMLVLATLSLANVRTAVEQKMRAEGPYGSWPEFAMQMAPYILRAFPGRQRPRG